MHHTMVVSLCGQGQPRFRYLPGCHRKDNTWHVNSTLNMQKHRIAQPGQPKQENEASVERAARAAPHMQPSRPWTAARTSRGYTHIWARAPAPAPAMNRSMTDRCLGSDATMGFKTSYAQNLNAV